MKNFIITFFLCLSVAVLAQTDDDPFNPGNSDGTVRPVTKSKSSEPNMNNFSFDKSKFRISPGFGLAFDGRFFSMSLSSRLGYRAIKYVEPGVGLSYQFQNIRADRTFVGYEGHTVGGSIYLRVYPYRELFLHVEGVMKNFWFRDKVQNQQKPPFNTVTYGNVLAGLGYHVVVGNKTWFTPMLLINLMPNRLYNNTYQVLPEFNLTLAF